MKLLVRNLSRSTTEQELRVLFSEHGSVADCNLVLDQETGKSKGFAFVEMPNEDEAQTAIIALNASSVAKSKIRVKRWFFSPEEVKAWMYPIARSKIDKDTKFSEIPVLIRATGNMPFGEIQKVVAICRDKDIQIYKISLEIVDS